MSRFSEETIRASAIAEVDDRAAVRVTPWGGVPSRVCEPRTGGVARGHLNYAVALLLLATITISAISVVAALRGGHLVFNDGCGDDGYTYCTMVVGVPASRPWSRRVLLPALVRLVVGDNATLPDLPGVFLAFNLSGLAVVAVTSGILAARLTRRRRRRALAAALAASFVLVSPIGFRWTWMYPALVDPFAMALGTAAVLAVISKRPSFRFAAPLFAAGATLSRETWAVVLAMGILAFVGIPRSRDRLLLLALSAIVIGSALAVVLLTPGVRNPVTDRVDYYSGYARYYLASVDGWRHWTWMTLFCFGVVPLAAVLRPVRALAWVRDHPERRVVRACLAMILANALLGLVGGADFHRFMFSVMPFLIALAIAAALDEAHEGFLAAAFVVSCIVWQSWRSTDGTREGYLSFYSPSYVSPAELASRFRADVSFAAAFLVLSLDTIVLNEVARSRRRRVRS